MMVGGRGWKREEAAQQKVMQGGGATRCDMTPSRLMRGNQEEKWTTGGRVLQGGSSLSRDQEEVAAQQQGQRNSEQG